MLLITVFGVGRRRSFSPTMFFRYALRRSSSSVGGSSGWISGIQSGRGNGTAGGFFVSPAYRQRDRYARLSFRNARFLLFGSSTNRLLPSCVSSAVSVSRCFGLSACSCLSSGRSSAGAFSRAAFFFGAVAGAGAGFFSSIKRLNSSAFIPLYQPAQAVDRRDHEVHRQIIQIRERSQKRDN